MMTLLGRDTRGDFRDGPLQDALAGRRVRIFPRYTLGAMYAAQWFAAIRRQVP